MARFSLANSNPSAPPVFSKASLRAGFFSFWHVLTLGGAVSPLVDFSDPAEPPRWSSIDDRVMGGVSQSSMSWCLEGYASFCGTVSLERNGGFASVRSTERTLDLTGATRFVLSVRGDGRAYKFNLRPAGLPFSANYQGQFTPPAGQWVECVLNLSDLRPVFRGREVPGLPALSPVRFDGQLGFVTGDRQPGEFRLDIRWLAATSAMNLHPQA